MTSVPRLMFVLFSLMAVFLRGLEGCSKDAFQLPACPAVPKEKMLRSGSLGTINLQKNDPPNTRPGPAERLRKVNIVPLALIQSESEQAEERLLGLNSEKRQLTELWSATIARSEDIQFVLTSLQETSNPKHTTSTTMRYVSGALFNVLQNAPLMLPAGGNTMPIKLGAGLGGNMVSSLFKKHQEDGSKVSREQGCILYTMIRNIADRLVENYRNYRRALDEYAVAQTDLDELQDLAMQAGGGWSAADQFQFEYTIRKARREARSCAERASSTA